MIKISPFVRRLKITTLITVIIVTFQGTSITPAQAEADDTTLSDLLNTYKNAVYVKDFGAYGDGIHDDTKAINNALNSGADAVVFDANASYKTTDYILMKTNGVTVIGNNATLFTDNDYRSRADYYEWYFNVVADNITIDGIHILAKETILVGYKTQFTLRYSSNVVIKNCSFTIPSTVLSEASTRDVEYSNVDFFTGWHNVSLSNCILTILADANQGTCLQMRDIWSAGCNNGSFTDSICISNSHDEILSLFSSVTASISDIHISGNTFTADKGMLSTNRNIGISLGYSSSKYSGINGVTFQNNTLLIQSDYVLFFMGNSKNVIVSDNTINYTTLSSKSSAYLVRGAASDNQVLLNNNTITIHNNPDGNLGGLATGRVKFDKNSVISKAAVTNALFAEGAAADSNTITVNHETRRIGYRVSDLKNNTITSKGLIKTMFEFYNDKLMNHVNIIGNTITCDTASSGNDTLLMLNGTELNGYVLTLKKNTIEIPTSSSTKTLYYISLKDTTNQQIRLTENQINGYTKKTITNATPGVVCKIVSK